MSEGYQETIRSKTFPLPIDDIDTDQIFPAEFLTTIEREGLGRCCFYYWRFESDGQPIPDNPLTGFEPDRHQVLVAGRNFGCGSSREHAPWALLDLGVRAIISVEFADIFYSNALKNGLLPIALDEAAVIFLFDHPGTAVNIHIPTRTVEIDGYGKAEFPLDAFSGHCLMEGIDQLEFLVRQEELIGTFEQQRR